MKRTILLLIVGLFLFGCGGQAGMKIYIQGVDLDWIKERQWSKVAAGVVASVATHELAHYVVAEAKGLDPCFVSPTHIEYAKDDVWVDRAGFTAQLGIGTLLNLIPATRDSDFTIGWNAVSMAELFTYGIRNDGKHTDFDPDHSVYDQDAWRFFAGVSTINTGLSIANRSE